LGCREKSDRPELTEKPLSHGEWQNFHVFGIPDASRFELQEIPGRRLTSKDPLFKIKVVSLLWRVPGGMTRHEPRKPFRFC